MFSEKFREVMKRPGVVAIATQGEDGPHLVNTWNSYLQIADESRLLIPAGYMHKTEDNLARDNRVLLTVGSHEVAGKMGPGTGFLLAGTAAFACSGSDFDAIKAKYPWARAAMVVQVASETQTL